MRSPAHLLRAFTTLIFRQGPGAAWRRAKEYLEVKARRRREIAAQIAAFGEPVPFPVSSAPPPVSAGPPLIALLMPVHNAPPEVLEAAIASVFAQSFAGWELCIHDDASTDGACLAVLARWKGVDGRLKITFGAEPLHIAEATNTAALRASAPFVGFLDHDDVLPPNALEQFAAAIAAELEADVLYSDEDKIEGDGSRSEPYLKPDWSPEHLQSVPYLLHLMLVRKSLFLSLGGCRAAYSGAQDYDLALRATSQARRVVHVPGVFYHWRKSSGSAAERVDAKPAALRAGDAALKDFVLARDPGASVAPGQFPGARRVLWSVDTARPVTVLILTKGQRRQVEGRGDILLLANAVRSIVERSTFANHRLLVVDNGPLPTTAREELLGLGVQVEVAEAASGPFNYAAALNAAARHVKTEDVIFLNDDIEVISPDWIEAMLAHSRREDIGAVGARLLYPNGRLQHAGIVLGVTGPTAHLFHNQPADEVGYGGYTHVVRNYSAVTGAVMATRMSLFREVGGYDPGFAIDYNDVDYCLRMGQLGRRTVWTPHATLYHFEGSSISRRQPAEVETRLFQERWHDLITRDPFYNPGLPRGRTDCAVSVW